MFSPGQEPIAWQDLLQEADAQLKRLFPLCRSLTGAGVKQSLECLQEVSPFEIHKIPSGTRCYDWEVPKEWNIRNAFIEDSNGRRVIDFENNNLHVVSYSVPIDRMMTFEQLRPHLHSLPEFPDVIPYRTSYYYPNWGFCLTQNQFDKMSREGLYHVVIDSSLTKGELVYGEQRLKGETEEEILVSTYCCHPSLANDNLSGMVLWSLLLRQLARSRTRYSYRFVIAPETIGAVCYLSKNEKAMQNVKGGFVITTVAGPGRLGYKSTYLGNHLMDRAVAQAFKDSGTDWIHYAFDINGSDETHFSSPFFRIPVGTICKDKYCEYDAYHTSLDNLDFINAQYLVETLKIYFHAIEILEKNVTYRSLHPYSEPMLGKRGLFPSMGGQINQKASDCSKDRLEREYKTPGRKTIDAKTLDIIRWLMFLSDGQTELIDIAEKTGFSFRKVHEVAQVLTAEGLLAPALET